ncbi:hypothetical protein [Microbispora sp. ATCC PTA-5024]|uniref:hypothetical protein n=1 Tax=Microbispora sp. ATCC PTA-5024 TaxID=316330 RepID=UPI0003DD68CB|nr:hypothetical protein [Microbispora sp. ATCC PTA-5024]ETK37746.1 hypothetical protein MPTA5024_02100 [Microbispora sp. ATCC PTA-5024]
MADIDLDGLDPQIRSDIQAAVRLAQVVKEAKADGDLEGHSFDDEDILDRHAAANIICCT